MQIGFKYYDCQGFGRLYNYGLKYYPNYMITKEAEERLRILKYWKKYGLEATTNAFGAKRSTLYAWWKKYKDSGYKLQSLNPGKQARINVNKRALDPLILKKIKRLRLKVCPNMGKAKVKKYLDIYCIKNSLPIYSESKIGRIIKEKKIYHHRQKVYHDGTIKIIKRKKKLRKPSNLVINKPGDLIEIDTIVKFTWGIKRYIVTAVDIETRYSFALGYRKHDSASAKDFFIKLEQVFPYEIKTVQTDNGSEFHKYFMQCLEEQKITHYWNYKGQPYKNGHIEKYNRTIQEEFIDQNEILLEEVNLFNQKLVDWLIWYNTERYHWSLNLTSPVDYLLKNNLMSNMCWTNTFYYINKKILIMKKITLRKLKKIDLKYFTKWWRDSDLLKLTSGILKPITDKEFEKYFSAMLQSMVDYHFMIQSDKKTIGHIALVKRRNNNYETQMVIGEKNYWDKGIGTTALELLIKKANRLGIIKIYLEVRTTNKRAIRVYEKCGFKKLKTIKYPNNKYLSKTLKMAL